MKHQKKRSKGRSRQETNKNVAAQANGADRIRRNALARLRNWGVLTAVVAAGIWYLVQDVTATIAEHDLTRIGNGVPAVVQIHDERCTACVALQREARDAMREFEEDELQYLVADMKSPAGRNLAAAHGVANVTLLLFDGDGRRRKTLSGPSTTDILAHYFRSHVTRYRAKR